MYVKPANGYEEVIHSGQKQFLVIDRIEISYMRDFSRGVSKSLIAQD